MYAVFNEAGEIQQVTVRGYLFACIFGSEKEAYKVIDAMQYGPNYEVKPVKVF